jgi:hypothetical protein
MSRIPFRKGVVVVLGLLLAGCGSASVSSPEPTAPQYSVITPTATSSATEDQTIVCATFGGCDVQVDLRSGDQEIIPLATMSFTTADQRALAESARPEVLVASVIGHDRHNGLGGSHHSR